MAPNIKQGLSQQRRIKKTAENVGDWELAVSSFAMLLANEINEAEVKKLKNTP